MAQAAAISGLVMERVATPAYETAGGGEGRGRALELLVAFSETASIGEISDLLKRVGAVVVDRPKGGAVSSALARDRRGGTRGRNRNATEIGGGEERAARTMRSAIRSFSALVLIWLVALSSSVLGGNRAEARFGEAWRPGRRPEEAERQADRPAHQSC